MEISASCVRRGRPNGNYTVIANALITNLALSSLARLTLIYLLSKPMDWELRLNDLRRVLGVDGKLLGRDKAYKVLAELKASRYVRAEQVVENGRFVRMDYVVFDEPFPENQDAAPLPEIPDTENQDTTKERKKQTTDPKIGRGCRLPADFQPDRSWAVEQGMSSSDVIREHARFTDYWNSVAGPKGVKRDWQATWRNWVRSAVDRRRPRRSTASSNADGLFAICRSELSSLETREPHVIEHQ